MQRPNEELTTSADDSQTKAVSLFTFVREFARLSAKPVTSLDSYIKTFWLDQIPNEPECRFAALADLAGSEEEAAADNWLAVARPELPEPPPVADDLAPWVDMRQWEDSSQEIPELYAQIPNPQWNSENPEDKPQFLSLADYPQVSEQWDDYLETKWWPWAEKDRRKRRVHACYAELFALHRSQVAAAEQFEFLLAVGCLHWSPTTGTSIKRHLLVLPVTVDFDPANAVVSVRSSGTTPEVQLETDMLAVYLRPPTDIQQAAEMRRSGLGDNLFHPDAKELLRAYAQGLDSEGEFADNLDRVAGTSPRKPVVAFAPALIVRRRTSRSLIAVCNSIIDQLQDGIGVPPGVRKLTGELGVDKTVFGEEGEEDGNRAAQSGEVFFPLPSNDEQRQILGRLSRQVGVLVQGPPGTGKSLTIANLICHLLATGRRILVTSQKAPALRVLREKLPHEVADLCIMVLGEGTDEQQELRRSVGEIAGRHSNWSRAKSERSILRLEEELKRARGKEAEAYEMLCAAREKEVFIHPARFGAYEGSLSDIAAQVRRDTERFAWFADRPSGSVDLLRGSVPACPATQDEAKRLLALLRQIGPAEEAESRNALVPLKDLPSTTDFRKMVEAEREAKAEVDAKRQHLVHPARGALSGATDEELRVLCSRVKDLYGRLCKARESVWEWNTVERIVRESAGSIETLRQASGALLSAIDAQMAGTVDMEVKGLDRSVRVALEDARELHQHLAQGGWCGFWVFRAAPAKRGLYLIRQVTVDGRPCNSAEVLARLVRWLELQESKRQLEDQWAGLGADLQTDIPLNQMIGHYRALQARLDELLDLGRMVEGYGSILAAHDQSIVVQWHRSESILSLLQLLETLLAERRLQREKQLLDDALAIVHDVSLSPRSAPENHRLRNGILNRLPDEYSRSHGELCHLWELRQLCEEKGRLLAKLSRILPELVAAMVASPQDEVWESRIAALSAAWNWLCAGRWVAQMVDPRQEDLLSEQMKRARQDVSNSLSRLAAEKAWQHCMTSMTEGSFQSLMAWRKAIEKVGKGTGKYAERNRDIARDRLEECRDAIPAWVMPLYKVLDTVAVRPGMFDVAIVDEASQSGPEALFLGFLAKQIVVVGDDQQIRPEHVGIDHGEVHQLQRLHLADVPNGEIFDATSSLFGIAEVRFGNQIRLREHFRCMPEIISFSNNLCYQDQPLIPLRQFGTNRLIPVLSSHYVSGGYQEKGKINPVEAEVVVDAIERCCADPAYEGKTFGVISLLNTSDQDREIESRLMKRVDAEEIEQRNIVCGDAYDFQGDERDVIFLSMVSARSADHRVGTLSDDKAKRRFNVAVSRARDQVFLFHSVQEGELGQDCLRRRLIEHMKRPMLDPTGSLSCCVEELRTIARTRPRSKGNQPPPFESWFEVDVYLAIVDQGHMAIPHYRVSGYEYWIDIVIVGGTRKVAVECDGDYWHGPERYAADLHRQTQLERCGWEFFRVRGSRFYRDPASALLPLWKMLEEHSQEEWDGEPTGENDSPVKPSSEPGAESGQGGAPESTAVDRDVPPASGMDGEEHIPTPSEIPSEEGNGMPFSSAPRGDERINGFPAASTRKQPSAGVGATRGVSNVPLDEVLAMPNRRLGAVICEIIQECPNYTIKRDDLPSRVSKYFGFITRSSPRAQLGKKIGWALTHLKKAGLVEEYKATNVRIRLLHPSKQQRLF